MKPGSDPAFPMVEKEEWLEVGSGGYRETHTSGLTKREYFAAMAMQSIVNRVSLDIVFEKKPDETMGSFVARESIRYADALLAELAKGEK